MASSHCHRGTEVALRLYGLHAIISRDVAHASPSVMYLRFDMRRAMGARIAFAPVCLLGGSIALSADTLV